MSIPSPFWTVFNLNILCSLLILPAEDASRPQSPVPAQKQVAQPAPAVQKAKSGPASRGGNYYSRGGGTKPAPKDSAGNLNQNGIEEPVAKKCV